MKTEHKSKLPTESVKLPQDLDWRPSLVCFNSCFCICAIRFEPYKQRRVLDPVLVSPRIPCSPNSHSSPAITMRPYCLTLSAADVLRQTICVTFRVCLSQQDFSQGFTLQSWVVLRLFGPLQRCRIKRCLSMKLLGLHGPSPVGAGDMKCKIQKSLQKSQTQRFSV